MKTSNLLCAGMMMATVSAVWGGEMEDLLAKATEGDAVAQYEVGERFSKGDGVSKSMEDAVKWLVESAVQGNVEAALSLGSLYVGGRGVPKNSTEGAKWFQMAAMQGRSVAQLQMARMHLAGAGVVKDDVEAYKWARLAADQKEAQANQVLTFLRERMTGVQLAQGDALAKGFILEKEAGEALDGLLPFAPPLDIDSIEPAVDAEPEVPSEPAVEE